MRLDYVIDLGFNYKHFLHTHSHIAFLGWMYNALIIALEFYFVKEQKTRFNQIFWITQITILGMLLSFPFQGYAFWSISFSTLYLFASYWLIIELFKQSKHINFTISKTLLKASGIFLFFSSIGPFGLAIVMTKHLGHTMWNDLSIYWFLHYLFNGFFFLLILSIILKELKSKIGTSNYQLTAISHAFIASVIPLYFSFTLEFFNNHLPLILSSIGAIFQLIGFVILFKPLVKYIKTLNITFLKLILRLFFTALFFKIIFQVLGNIQSIQTFVILSKPTVVIGFIHLVMLGVLSLFVFWFYFKFNLLIINAIVKTGVFLFMIGIFFSEVLLFSQSLFIYFKQISIVNYNLLLFFFSAFMPLGVLMLIMGYVLSKLK